MSGTSSSSQHQPGLRPASHALRERDERLDGLNSLVGQLAHDFNNYLVPLHGYLSLLKEEAPADTQVERYAQSMDNSVRKISGVLDAVLLATRPHRCYRPAQVDFSQLTRQALDQWRDSLPVNAQIHIHADFSPCSAWLDPDQWTRVLEELLKNARFALAVGGDLEVTLGRQTLSSELTAELGVARPETIHLVIRDNGIGLNEAALKRAFDPFFSTRPRAQALGLGLTIVHSVTRFNGGQVILESGEECGTRVQIWLPLQTQSPSSASSFSPEQTARAPTQSLPPSSRPRKPPSRGTPMLLVDDDPMVLEVVQTYLTRSQFEVRVAADGAEGLKIFRRLSHQLALVISDVTMPRLNGIEMVQQIRQINPDIPVILISGDPEGGSEENLTKLKPHQPPLIKKPFTLPALMQAIQQQLKAAD